MNEEFKSILAMSNRAQLDNITPQLAIKTDKGYVDTAVASVASGTPRTNYATLALLQAGIPAGNIYSYVCTDGHRYYWSGSTWVDGGIYQATGVADGSVTIGKTDFISAKMQYLYAANKITGKLYNLSGTVVQVTNASFFIYAPITLKAGTYYFANFYSAQSYIYDTVTLVTNSIKDYRGDTAISYTGLTTIAHDSILYLSYTFSSYPVGSVDPMVTNDIGLPIIYSEGLYELAIDKLKVKPMTVRQPYPFYGGSYIYNHKLYCNYSGKPTTAKYNGVDLGAGNVPSGMRAKAIFSEGSDSGSVVLISNPNGIASVPNIVLNSLHVVFTNSNLQIGIWVNSSLILLKTYTYLVPCNRDGITEYTFSWTVSGTTITVNCPDGTVQTVTDSRIPALMGRYCTFEQFCSGYDITKAIFTYFEISVNSVVVLTDNFARADGSIGVATTGQSYTQLFEV